MNRTFAMLASAAVISLALTAGHAAEAPLPPRVNHIATPASELYLGMTADDVTRVMGKAARETDFVVGSIQMRKLEFTNAIPGQVILKDGKVSRVTLDAFRVEQDALPSFIRQAWPRIASSAVRRTVGEPDAVRHHEFFGVEVDQWIYSRAADGNASVFFRANRVIAKATGRDVPADLFRVDLPSPPPAESEGPLSTPRVGMTSREIGELYGAAKLRVDYICNGQPASRVMYETNEKDALVSFTVIDGVVTELENLGRPDDAILQGG